MVRCSSKETRDVLWIISNHAEDDDHDQEKHTKYYNIMKFMLDFHSNRFFKWGKNVKQKHSTKQNWTLYTKYMRFGNESLRVDNENFAKTFFSLFPTQLWVHPSLPPPWVPTVWAHSTWTRCHAPCIPQVPAAPWWDANWRRKTTRAQVCLMQSCWMFWCLIGVGLFLIIDQEQNIPHNSKRGLILKGIVHPKM